MPCARVEVGRALASFVPENKSSGRLDIGPLIVNNIHYILISFLHSRCNCTQVSVHFSWWNQD